MSIPDSIVKNGHLKWTLPIAILLISTAACTTPRLTPQSELKTRVIAFEDPIGCQHIGYTKAGITEKNSKVTETENSFLVNEKLLITVRNLASDIGADTIVPVHNGDNMIQEFKLYICNAEH